MVAINAYRMDGLGNDFIIIDRRKNYIELTKDKIIELGNRANIGFDQIIFTKKNYMWVSDIYAKPFGKFLIINIQNYISWINFV